MVEYLVAPFSQFCFKMKGINKEKKAMILDNMQDTGIILPDAGEDWTDSINNLSVCYVWIISSLEMDQKLSKDSEQYLEKYGENASYLSRN